jgi:hypothetical protein
MEREVTTQELDQLTRTMREKKKLHEEAKEVASLVYADYEAAEKALLDAMVAAGKERYIVDGLGTVSVVEKCSVKMPDSLGDRLDFFNWMKSKFGEDVFWTTISVHSQRLNKIYNDEMEEANERGAISHVPGLALPNVYKDLHFRSAR